MESVLNYPLDLQLLEDYALRSKVFALGLSKARVFNFAEQVAKIDIGYY